MARYGPVLQALSLLLTIVAADSNRLVSNGTCYYAPGKEADLAYIPCGNAAFGAYACCLHGDTCLSSNACYNGKYGDTTYLAGCTDPTFSDPACGNKGLYSDQQWAGLVRCFVSNDTSSNNEEWAPCTESSQPTVTTPNQGCVCTASANTAVFTDNPTLTALAVLPADRGLSISWQPGHTPPSDLTPTTESSSSSSTTSSSSSTDTTDTSSSTASRTKSSTSTSTAAANTSPAVTPTSSPVAGSLSAGAEAGIGVGIGLGVLSICGILFLLYRRRQKKKQETVTKYSEVPHTSPYHDNSATWSSSNEMGHTIASASVANGRSPAWSGHKSELPANGRVPSMLVSELGSEDRASVYQPYNSYISDDKGTGTYSTWRNSTAPSLRLQEQTIHELPGSHT